MAIIDVLREAIASSGKTQQELAKETGIQQASISRFLTGKRGLRLEDAESLAVRFGLKLVAAKPKGASNESRKPRRKSGA